MVGAACGAGPTANGQRKCLKDEVAVRAPLRGRPEAVSDDHYGPISGGFVDELPAELTEALIEDRTGQSVVFAHAHHVEILNADDGEVVDKSSGEFVQGVFSDVRHSHVVSRQLEARFSAIARALLFAGEAALQSTLAS